MPKIKNIKTNIPPTDFLILLSYAINKPKEFILAHPEYKLNIFAYLKLKWFLYQAKQGYSIAAIIKNKEFFGLNFYINKHVLVPRPETEILVEEVIKTIQSTDTLIDIGTGSGCILISILKNIPIKNAFGLDISRQALCVAKKNSETQNVSPTFLHSDLLNTKSIQKKISPTRNIFITANLPYLTDEQFKNSLSIQKEPRLALVAKNQGLELYEKLFIFLSGTKDPFVSHSNIHFFLEIDPSQSIKIKTLITKYFPNAKIIIKKDFSGKERLVVIHPQTPTSADK
jgi:release factor glutamine methyltransferase